MTPSVDYPRMLFHRSGEWRIVQSADEEDELGGEWSRTIFQPPGPVTAEAEAVVMEAAHEYPRWKQARDAQLKSKEPPPPSPYDPPAPPKRSHKKKVPNANG